MKPSFCTAVVHAPCCLFNVYIVCFPTYPFASLFLTYLLPYLSFPLKIDPLRFQAGCRKKRLNLTLVVLCLFLRCSAFLLIGECVLLLCEIYFSVPSHETGLGKRLGNDLQCILCPVGRKTRTQSVNQSINQSLIALAYKLTQPSPLRVPLAVEKSLCF